jgi:hypothetical protein
MLLLYCIILVFLQIIAASPINPHHAPAPFLTNSQDRECLKFFHQCFSTTSMISCMKQHDCDPTKKDPHHPHQEECKAANLACANVLDECLQTIAPSYCTAQLYLEKHHIKFVPSPTTHSGNVPFPPIPPPPPPTPHQAYSPICEEAIKSCKATSSYQSCRSDAGCTDSKSVSNVCKYADSLCRELLEQCLLFFAPKDCTL